MSHKKQVTKLILAKEKSSLPTEDWNNRFWIDKIPEYKPKSALLPIKNCNMRSNPAKLPKIHSAHILFKEISPTIRDVEILKTTKTESESISRIDTSISIRNGSNTRLSMINSKRNSKRISKVETEELKKTNRISYHNLQGKNSESQLKKNSPKNGNLQSLDANTASKQLPSLSKEYSSHYLMKLPDLDDLFDTYEIKEISSESEEDELITKEIKQISIEISDEMIANFINQIIQDFVVESCKEMVSAALVLFSSSVLDKYIQEVLGGMIPKVAKEVYREYTDIEYIDFQDLIFKTVIEEELTRIVHNSNIMLVCSNIMSDYCCLLPIEELVNESILEENACNKEIINSVGNRLVDCLIEEEWVEILAEDEINSLRLEQIWKYLPPNLQKELNKTHFHKIADRISEEMYFDILNEVVGGIWTESIVHYCLNNQGEEILDIIMPVKIKLKSSRKA